MGSVDLAVGSSACMLERAQEQQRIGGAIDDALAGRGSVVALEGDPGIGKSTLVAHASGAAAAAGMRVLAARGGELEHGIAYGVVCQLIEPVLTTTTGEEGARLLAGAAGLATPALALEAPAEGARRGSVLHGLYWLSANLAEERPLMIAVDDLHWADEPSRAYLAYLARRMRELPILIVCASRPREGCGEGLHDTLPAELAGILLRPRALTAASVAELVWRRLGEKSSAGFASACHGATGGNPFLLGELLRALADDGVTPVDANAERMAQLVPTAISRAILTRLRRLGPSALRLASAVAVLGADAQLRHAAVLAAVEADDAAEAADALAAAAILQPRRPLEFVHPVVRGAVYAEIGPARRARGHGLAARLLSDEGAPAQAVAAHLLATEPAGDPWVVARLRESGSELLRRGAPRDATHHLLRALGEPPPAADRAAVLLDLGIAEARSGLGSATGRLADARRQAADVETAAAAAQELAGALTFIGDERGAVELLERTLSELGAGHARIARGVEIQLFVLAGMNPSVIALIAHRLRRARGAWRGGESLAPAVLSVLALAPLSTGRAADAVALATSALADGGLIDRQEPESPAVYFATCALTLCDHAAAAARHLDAALALARAQGSARATATVSCFRAYTRLREGDVVGAEADAASALDLAGGAALAVLRPVLAATLVDCLTERGEPDGAEAVLGGVDRRALDPDSSFTVLLHESVARLRLAQQRPRDALTELAACADWARRGAVTRPAWVSWRSHAALAHLALGERRRAASLVEAELALARDFGAERSLAIALRAAGLVAGGERGLALLDRSVRAAERSGARLEHTRSLLELGGALRRAGQRSDAREPLRGALELADRGGALALAAAAREQLVASGARPRRAARSGVEALTASEHRVARMAADGLPNRDIAQALFVTVRTVETHLTHAYRKLAVSTRDQLPAALSPERRQAA